MAREMEKYLVEFLGTSFFLYVIISTGNALAIGAALAIANNNAISSMKYLTHYL